MSRKAKHNAVVRQRILDAAGLCFRTQGYHAAKIDQIMTEAGLTRGAFYAHFPDKAQLFAAVLAMEPLLLRWLRARSEAAPDALWLAMKHVFRAYLAPENHPLIARHCSLAALQREANLSEPTARSAYGAAYAATRAEMHRGSPRGFRDGQLDGVLSLSLGAVATATTIDDPSLVRQTLVSAQKSVEALFAKQTDT